MRKLLFVVSIGLGLMYASPAKAHDPIILTSDQRTPDDGPLLPDGTVSFALYGTLESSGDTRGFRVTFAEGDPLYVSLLIPDLAPENALGDDQLPRLDVVDPSGTSTSIVPTTRVVFAEPFTGTNYIRLADLVGPAVAGTYSVTISGGAPLRFTVSVGTKELFGTPVEDVPNRELGVAGVMTWYETPPVAASIAPSTMPASPPTPDDSSSTEAPMTSEVESDSAGAGTETSQESDDRSSLPLVIAVAIGVSLVGAVVARRRSHR